MSSVCENCGGDIWWSLPRPTDACTECNQPIKRAVLVGEAPAGMTTWAKAARPIEIAGGGVAEGEWVVVTGTKGGWISIEWRDKFELRAAEVPVKALMMPQVGSAGKWKRCVECGNDLNGYRGPRCRYCEGTAE